MKAKAPLPGEIWRDAWMDYKRVRILGHGHNGYSAFIFYRYLTDRGTARMNYLVRFKDGERYEYFEND